MPSPGRPTSCHLILIAVLVWLPWACDRKTSERTSATHPTAQAVDTRDRLERPPPTTVAELEARLRDPWQPRPDARFLDAIVRIERILAGTDSASADLEVALRDASWHVTLDGRAVTELALLPDFDALDGALRHWARRRLDEVAPIARPPEAGSVLGECLEREYDGPALLARLESSAARWASERSRRQLEVAACGWVTLELLREDTLGTADGVAAQAWALLAVLAAASDTRAGLDEARARLASRLGYVSPGPAVRADEDALDATARAILDQARSSPPSPLGAWDDLTAWAEARVASAQARRLTAALGSGAQPHRGRAVLREIAAAQPLAELVDWGWIRVGAGDLEVDLANTREWLANHRGSRAAPDLLVRAGQRLEPGSPPLRSLAVSARDQLDTRPAHAPVRLWLARHVLLDPGLVVRWRNADGAEDPLPAVDRELRAERFVAAWRRDPARAVQRVEGAASDGAWLGGLVEDLYLLGEHEAVEALGASLPISLVTARGLVRVYQVEAARRGHTAAMTALHRRLADYEGATDVLGLVVGAEAHGLGADRVAFALLRSELARTDRHGEFARMAWVASARRLDDGARLREVAALGVPATSPHYARLMRMVSGALGTEPVFAPIERGQLLCEASWYAAVAAAADGRHDEAELWLRLTVESDARTNSEWVWARSALVQAIRALEP